VNYLGHLVLSGNDNEVLFGNFIADAVKGNDYLDFSKKVQEGILLHRFIDNFTDTNSHYLAGKRRFYEGFPKMGGVVNDIIYDYLLWQYELNTKSLNLEKEIIRYYNVLDRLKNEMPTKIRFMYRYMKRDDWLNNYKNEKGIKRALHGIGRRINYSNDLEKSFEVYKMNELSFNKEFNAFFQDIKSRIF
tara:strand:+ start:8551 stop:9117 length:567 start_codon:yes stop_codon:yes gene_type:complete